MDTNRTLEPAKWIENYSDTLYSYTLQRVNNNEQAEDIVQETFLSAWKARETYNGTASEKNWLYAICKNKIIDYYRKAAASKEVYAGEENSDDFFTSDGHFNETYKAKSWDMDFNTQIDTKEFYSILKQCKSKLKEIQQDVFSMKYLEDVDTNEICKSLNITVQNYWILIHRAKIQLRTCLEKNWVKA